MVYWIVRFFVWILLRLIFAFSGGIRFEGRENIPRQGGVLITPNHISDSDPPTVAVALPRACYFMAKEELFAKRILGPFIRLLRAFPVKRYTADRAALRYAQQLLEQGEAVVIFPEGKLSEDGCLQPLLPGVLLIARHAGVPIVPTIVIATDRLLPYGAVWPRHAGRTIEVHFGRPVTFAELAGEAQGSEALRQGAERLYQILHEMQQRADGKRFLRQAGQDE